MFLVIFFSFLGFLPPISPNYYLFFLGFSYQSFVLFMFLIIFFFYGFPARFFSGFPTVLSYFSRLLFLLFGFFLSKFRSFHVSPVFFIYISFQFLPQPVVEVEWIFVHIHLMFKHQGEIFSFFCSSVLMLFSLFIFFGLLRVWTSIQRDLFFVVKLSLANFEHIFSIYISASAATCSARGMGFSFISIFCFSIKVKSFPSFVLIVVFIIHFFSSLMEFFYVLDFLFFRVSDQSCELLSFLKKR